jgi:hypothetical protein
MGASPASAQARAGGRGPVAVELAELNDTMAEMRELLTRQLETQTLDLLFKRTELASNEVLRLDRSLRRATNRRIALDKERVELELREEALDDFDRRRERGQAAPSAQNIELQLRNIRASTERVEERLRELDTEIVGLESSLDERLRDLEEWQQMLDRRLAAM